MSLKIVPRDEWRARMPVLTTAPLALPISDVYCVFTGTSECFQKRKCLIQIRKLQKFHIYQKKFGDIRYNFLVGCDGNVYEGRGWNTAAPMNHRDDFNKRSILIALISAYKGSKVSDQPPPKVLFEVLHAFINFGISQNFIKSDASLHFASSNFV